MRVATECYESGAQLFSRHYLQRERERIFDRGHLAQLLKSKSTVGELTRPIPKQFDGYKAYNYQLSGKAGGRRFVVWFHVLEVGGGPFVIWGSGTWRD